MRLYDIGYLKHLFHSLRLLSTNRISLWGVKSYGKYDPENKKSRSFL